MRTNKINLCFPPRTTPDYLHYIRSLNTSKGQAIVEFTLCFILLLIVAWIPADFGLAFYTGQVAQNASREGARIAAAERTLPALPASCTMPCSAATDILAQTAKRASYSLMPDTTITLSMVGSTATCDALVNMRVEGNYSFFFYRVLKLMGGNVPTTANIVRETSMRWEHQC